MADRTISSTMTVADLLDKGSWALAQCEQVRADSIRLREEARELVLTFRSHRLRLVSGASDTGNAHVGKEDALVHRLRAVALLGTVKTYVGLSRGGMCSLCHRNIAEGDMEYELVEDVLEVCLDADCYRRLHEESARN
jgi:hypothetical protein